MRIDLPEPRRVLLLARRWWAFLLLLASLVPVIVFRASIDAQTAAFVVLATTIDTPVISWVAAASTPDPEVEETTTAGQSTTIVRPGSGERWPAVVFVNGATERGRLHPDVQRLARGLARAGFLVVVPELPGLRRGQITLPTLAKLIDVARRTADRPDAAEGRVGFIGVSVGASLALAAAEHDSLNRRVSAVAGIAPYADLKEVARLATTGYVQANGKLEPYDADDFVLLAVARSLAAGLPSRRDRKRLTAVLVGIPNERDEPLAAFSPPPSLGRGGQALVRLLENRDPQMFEPLWRRLPAHVRAAARRLSPLARAERLTMPVLLATSPEDDYFPVSESERLASRSEEVRVTVTESLSHAIPEPSFGGVGAALRFNGFVVRGLRELRG